MPRPVVAVCEPVRPALVEALGEVARVVYEPDAWPDQADVVAAAADADALVTRTLTRVNERLLSRLERVGCVAVYGAGRDHLDREALARRGIHLVRCSEEVAASIAEFTLGLALCLVRRIPDAMNAVRAGVWSRHPFVGEDLAGKRALVVGCGPIGQRVAHLFASVGVGVTVARATATPLPDELAELGCSLARMPDALTEADLVTLHVSGGPQTVRLVGEQELAALPTGSYLINTSRGSVVDLDAVVSALESGQLAGAALDVLPQEPPAEAPILHPRLWVTPHLALYSQEAIERRIASIVRQVGEWLATTRGARQPG